MDIARVDRVATQGTSALHRSAPVPKLIAFACALSAVIVSSNLLVVLAIGVALIAVAMAMRLPMRSVLALAAYPALFAALFAFAMAPSPLGAALIMAKATTAALCAVLLVFTTPYPAIFAPVQRIVPAVVGDALLMTYRSFFLLLERFGHMSTAMRLRAGLVGAQPARSAALLARSLGGVLLYSVDLSQRTYDVMRLRGYDGRLAVTPPPSVSRSLDAATILSGIALLGVALVWRVFWPVLTPYAWLPLLAAIALAMLVGVTASITSRKERS